MSKYEMHPRGQHTSGLPSLCMVLTPDGGIIECKHEDSALRVIHLLNSKDARIAELEAQKTAAANVPVVCEIEPGMAERVAKNYTATVWPEGSHEGNAKLVYQHQHQAALALLTQRISELEAENKDLRTRNERLHFISTYGG